MSDNFPNVLPVTLAYEGAWSDHPKDPGGATMKGVTLAVYREYKPGATKADLRAITPAEIQMIYRKGYWNPIRGDELPYGVDLATFDYGVNSGVKRASKGLQTVVGVDPDGKIGSVTIGRVVNSNGKEVIQGLCGRRLSFVEGLATFKTFGKGWSRRIADVEAKAVSMWLTAARSRAPDPVVSVRDELALESVKADDEAKAENKKAGGSVAGGGTVGGADVVVNGGPNWYLIAALAAVVIAAVVVFVIRSRQHRERAEAYAAEAAN